MTPSLLRKVPLPRLISQVHADLLDAAARGDMHARENVTPQWLRNLQSLSTRREPGSERKGGRPPVAEELLRRVAVAYLQEQHAGRGLRERIAERVSEPPHRIPDLIRGARKLELLTPAEAGKRGAGPGAALLDSYRNADKAVTPAARQRAARKLAQGRAEGRRLNLKGKSS